MRRTRQLVSAGLAIALGVAFVATTLLLTASAQRSIQQIAAGPVDGAAVVLSSSARGELPPLVAPEQLEPIRSLPGVQRVRPVVDVPLLQRLANHSSPLGAYSLPEVSDRTTLVSGRLPQRPDEVLIDEQAAAARDLAPGRPLVVEGHDGPATLQVTGILRPGPEVVSGQHDPLLFATEELLFKLRGRSGYDAVYVWGSDPERLRAQIAGLPGIAGTALTVRTGTDEVAARVQDYSSSTQALATLLLGFAAVSIFVAGLVIANTFAILVVQRTRELGLQRCIGATRGQVFGQVLREALGLGAVASAIGLLFGLGLAWLGIRAGEGTLELSSLATPWWALVPPLLLGIAITVLSALSPARRATRVAPLAALQPIPVSEGRRAGVIATALGGLCFAAGLAGLIWAGRTHSPEWGIAAGAVNFLGVLLLARLLVPGFVGVLRPLLGVAGPSGAMAVANARRNPARAASTASALLVGVTLIAMMVTGAATVQRSAQVAMDRQYPADAQLSSPEPLTAEQLSAVARVPGVSGVAAIRGARVPIEQNGRRQVDKITAVSPAAKALLKRPQLVEAVTDGVLVAGRDSGWRAGEPVLVGEPGLQQRLTVVISTESDALLVSDATGDRLGLPAANQAFVGFAPGADPGQLEQRVAEAAGPTAQVAGVAGARAQLTQIVDLALQIVTALLAVAVLIALIGVGNTLGLSVLERTRESALLRALGLTRGQLRGMLALEALSLGLVAVLLGAALGVGYGIAGAYAMVGGTITVEIAVPVLRLGGMAAVALAAGWLASVLPSRRAARVAPAAAMALE